jgi:hypothetical protein
MQDLGIEKCQKACRDDSDVNRSEDTYILQKQIRECSTPLEEEAPVVHEHCIGFEFGLVVRLL